MSLKAFHVVFIIASILLAFGFAAWALVNYAEAGEHSLLWYGIGSTVAGIALVGYFAYVLKKLRNVSYL
jgi:hypothetical protein